MMQGRRLGSNFGGGATVAPGERKSGLGSAIVDRTSQGSVFVAEVSLAHVCLCAGLHRGDSSHPNAQGALLTVHIRYDNGPAEVAFLGLFSQRSMDSQCEITITI